MPSAGRFTYPVRSLDDSIPYLKRVYEVAGPVASREVVAQALEMAPLGGGFSTLVSAMQNYGLVETGGGQVRVTDLGKNVAFERDPTLSNQARAEAVSHVDLFREYHGQYGSDVTNEKVGVFLRKAGADVAQLPKLTEGIGKLLKDNLHYMTAVHARGQASISETASVAVGPPPGTGGGRENVIPMNDNLIEFRMGTYLMRFPMDDTETAKSVIDALLDKKSKSPQSTSKDDQ